MRGRREVAARADGPARRYNRMDAAVQHLEEEIDDGRPDPRETAREEFARTTSAARTSASSSTSPTPAAWLRTRFSWSCSMRSRGMRTSESFPKPVVTP